jgi:DNA-binding Xre family transcriptional regulator
MISFDNLWKTMKKRGITQYALIKTYNISPAQITRLKRNESVSTHTIEVFCKILESKTIRLPHQIFHAILTLPCPT